MRKPRYLTLARIANHDFNRSLRVWRKQIPSQEIITRLLRERRKAMMGGLRAWGAAIVLMFWLAANKPELALHIDLIDVTIPSAYVNFALAVSICVGTIGLISYFVINDFIRIASNKLFAFDAPWSLTVLEDGENAWSLGVVQQFRFFASDNAHRLLGIISLLLILLPTLLVALTLYWSVRPWALA